MRISSTPENKEQNEQRNRNQRKPGFGEKAKVVLGCTTLIGVMVAGSALTLDHLSSKSGEDEARARPTATKVVSPPQKHAKGFNKKGVTSIVQFQTPLSEGPQGQDASPVLDGGAQSPASDGDVQIEVAKMPSLLEFRQHCDSSIRSNSEFSRAISGTINSRALQLLRSQEVPPAGTLKLRVRVLVDSDGKPVVSGSYGARVYDEERRRLSVPNPGEIGRIIDARLLNRSLDSGVRFSKHKECQFDIVATIKNR